MKYKVHRFNIKMASEQAVLEQFLNSLRGEVVAIIPNTTWFPKTQVDFLLKIRDKYSETLQLQEELENQISTVKKDSGDSDAGKARIKTLETQLAKIKTKEGIYMQPMLAAQWRYLYSMMDQADQLPGKDALDRFEELSALLENIRSDMPD